MMSKPKFRSDEEFANWVESAEGRDLIHKQYDEAKNKGALRREVPQNIAAILSKKPQSAVSIHLRVPANDLEKARSSERPASAGGFTGGRKGDAKFA